MEIVTTSSGQSNCLLDAIEFSECDIHVSQGRKRCDANCFLNSIWINLIASIERTETEFHQLINKKICDEILRFIKAIWTKTRLII